MPTIDEFSVGSPCWVELFTSDAEKSIAFYGELFGWTAEETGPEFGNYINFHRDGVQIAGCMRNDGSQGMPDLWTTYLCSDDAEKTAEATTTNGGQIHVAPMPVGDLGVMAFVTGADGAAVGIWQPGQHTGFGVVGEPGAPAWFELHTREYEKAVDFYGGAFRWDAHTMSDADDFRYTTLGEGDHAAAGIMDAAAMLPEGVPSHWAVYFGTADTDASVAKVLDLGGAVVQPAVDTPHGRLAACTDPTGAALRVVQPPAAA